MHTRATEYSPWAIGPLVLGNASVLLWYPHSTGKITSPTGAQENSMNIELKRILERTKVSEVELREAADEQGMHNSKASDSGGLAGLLALVEELSKTKET